MLVFVEILLLFIIVSFLKKVFLLVLLVLLEKFSWHPKIRSTFESIFFFAFVHYKINSRVVFFFSSIILYI